MGEIDSWLSGMSAADAEASPTRVAVAIGGSVGVAERELLVGEAMV